MSHHSPWLCALLPLLLAPFVLGAYLPVRPADTVRLASLDLSQVDQGFGKPQVDRSVDGHPLTIGGRQFEHGLGTHSPGVFVIDLNGGSSRFSTWVGIDDEVGKRGSAEFQVVADGKLLWSSGVLRGGEAPKTINLDVTGVHQLALLVDDAGDGYEYDHADWADAEFTVTGAHPKAALLAPSHPTVAPTLIPAKPRITSPGVFGVYTGTPVLYTIHTAGHGPFTFSATGLPPGLKLDKTTGRSRGL